MPLSTVYIRFSAHGPDAPQRSPLLERLIARASIAVPVADWRIDALRAIAPGATRLPPVAPPLWRRACGTATGAWAWACVATPVHLTAGASSVVMSASVSVQLDAGEADALAAGFNEVFGGDQMRLVVGHASVLLCLFDRSLSVAAWAPDVAAGRDVFEFQPTGSDAPFLRRLMSEMEMWLFDHDVNRRRAQRGQPVVTGLWLWGGGATAEAAPSVHGWTAGTDPFFCAFGAEPGFPPAGGAGVCVLTARPGSAEWSEAERCWLAPAAAALRAGRISRLQLSAAALRFSVGTGLNWRFWRRGRPWFESFPGASDAIA